MKLISSFYIWFPNILYNYLLHIISVIIMRHIIIVYNFRKIKTDIFFFCSKFKIDFFRHQHIFLVFNILYFITFYNIFIKITKYCCNDKIWWFCFMFRCKQIYYLVLNIWTNIWDGLYINCTVRGISEISAFYFPEDEVISSPSQFSACWNLLFVRKKRDQSRSLSFSSSQRTGHSISSCLFCRSFPRWISFSHRIWTSSKRCILF